LDKFVGTACWFASGREIATIVDFLRVFLQIDPEERGSIDELKSHRWLKQS